MGQAQRPVRAGPFVMLEVLVQDLDQMALAHDYQPVQAIAADGAKQPLADCVGTGSAEWRWHDLEADGHEDGVKLGDVLGVSIVDQEPDGRFSSSSSQATLRACCGTQAESGCPVFPKGVQTKGVQTRRAGRLRSATTGRKPSSRDAVQP